MKILAAIGIAIGTSALVGAGSDRRACDLFLETPEGSAVSGRATLETADESVFVAMEFEDGSRATFRGRRENGTIAGSWEQPGQGAGEMDLREEEAGLVGAYGASGGEGEIRLTGCKIEPAASAVSGAVQRAVLCRDFDRDRRRCRDEIESGARLPLAEARRLYFFTRVKTSSRRLFHVWMLGDDGPAEGSRRSSWYDSATGEHSYRLPEDVARVVEDALPDTKDARAVSVIGLGAAPGVGYPTYSTRSFGRKPNLGPWRVAVVTDDGRVLESIDFEIVDGEPDA